MSFTTRHAKKIEEIKNQRPWDYPTGLSMRLKDWWSLSRWVPSFQIFAVESGEWLTVIKIVIEEGFVTHFHFRENHKASSGELMIKEWKEESEK